MSDFITGLKAYEKELKKEAYFKKHADAPEIVFRYVDFEWCDGILLRWPTCNSNIFHRSKDRILNAVKEGIIWYVFADENGASISIYYDYNGKSLRHVMPL